MALDHERRLCLPERVRTTFGIRESDHVFLTLDHEGVLLAFRNTQDLREYAHSLVEKTKVSCAEAEFVLFSYNAQVSVDGRGRIAIPLNLYKQAHMEDKDLVIVIVMPKLLMIMAPDAATRKRARIIRKMAARNADGEAGTE